MAFVFSTKTGDISTSTYIDGSIIGYRTNIPPGETFSQSFQFTLTSPSRIVTAIDIHVTDYVPPGSSATGSARYSVTVARGTVTIFNRSGTIYLYAWFKVSDTVFLPPGTHTYTITVQNTAPAGSPYVSLTSFITVSAVR